MEFVVGHCCVALSSTRAAVCVSGLTALYFSPWLGSHFGCLSASSLAWSVWSLLGPRTVNDEVEESYTGLLERVK